MVKKINSLFAFLVFFLFLNFNSFANNHIAVEFDPSASGGPKRVKLPKAEAKKFLRDKGYKEGLNERSSGGNFFIAIGQGSVTASTDIQMIHDSRFNAFREAMQKAKAEYVKFLGEAIQTSVSISIEENTMPDTIAEDAINNAVGVDSEVFKKLKKLLSLKIDTAMKKEGYDPALSDEKKKEILKKIIRTKETKSFFQSTAQQMIGGFQAWTVFEEADPGMNEQIVVIGMWSEKLAALAQSIYFRDLQIAPKGTPKIPIIEQLPLSGTPKDDKKLLQSFGAQQKVDENGNRVIIGFGHAAPLFENDPAALETACDMANDKAKQQIVMFSKENVMYSKLLNEIDKVETFEQNGQPLTNDLQGREYRLKIDGQAAIKNFNDTSIDEIALKDPRYGATDCVAIRMWSPQGVISADKTKDLLNKTTTGTSSNSSNVTGKKSSQGTTGSDDF